MCLVVYIGFRRVFISLTQNWLPVGTLDHIKPAAKVWLERGGRPVLGHGGAAILEAIREERSLSRATRRLGMSYRYVWSYLERMSRAAGEPVVETFKGGRDGGGGAELTRMGEYLLREYRRVERNVSELLSDEEQWKAAGLKIRIRNRLRGMVRSVEKEGAVTRVEMEIYAPTIITALISTEAEGPDLKVNDKVEVLIKANEVMIAKE